jgi:hypothetical protein
MPEVTPVDAPIVVFISSRQKEFQKLRYRLKYAIDRVTLFNRLLLKAELVEKRGGSKIRGDIEAALDLSTVYVGIFGNQYSPMTEWEFDQAVRRGILALIFDILPPRGSQTKRDPRVKNFLDRVKSGGNRVTPIVAYPARPSGRASLDPRNRVVIDSVTKRLANIIAEMVEQNLKIRKQLLSMR